MYKRPFLLILHCISLVLLGFGWSLNILTIDISAHFLVDIPLFYEKRSILGTLQSLWTSANYLPFILIALFGMIIPTLKSIAIILILLNNKRVLMFKKYLEEISKWAMADVFAISIWIAFLGAKSIDAVKANLEPGFYFFAAYVLVSAIISRAVSKIIDKQ